MFVVDLQAGALVGEGAAVHCRVLVCSGHVKWTRRPSGLQLWVRGGGERWRVPARRERWQVPARRERWRVPASLFYGRTIHTINQHNKKNKNDLGEPAAAPAEERRAARASRRVSWAHRHLNAMGLRVLYYIYIYIYIRIVALCHKCAVDERLYSECPEILVVYVRTYVRM